MHLVKVGGTMLLGIHLVVQPLLVLAANQVQRFSSSNEAYGPVGAHNLDEDIGSSKVFLDRAWYLRGMGHGTART